MRPALVIDVPLNNQGRVMTWRVSGTISHGDPCVRAPDLEVFIRQLANLQKRIETPIEREWGARFYVIKTRISCFRSCFFLAFTRHGTALWSETEMRIIWPRYFTADDRIVFRSIAEVKSCRAGLTFGWVTPCSELVFFPFNFYRHTTHMDLTFFFFAASLIFTEQTGRFSSCQTFEHRDYLILTPVWNSRIHFARCPNLLAGMENKKKILKDEIIVVSDLIKALNLSVRQFPWLDRVCLLVCCCFLGHAA